MKEEEDVEGFIVEAKQHIEAIRLYAKDAKAALKQAKQLHKKIMATARTREE